jgi:hypothetical protein
VEAGEIADEGAKSSACPTASQKVRKFKAAGWGPGGYISFNGCCFVVSVSYEEARNNKLWKRLGSSEDAQPDAGGCGSVIEAWVEIWAQP